MDASQSGARNKCIKKAEKAKKEAKDVAAVTTGWTGALVGQLLSSNGDTFALALLHGMNLLSPSRHDQNTEG